MDSFLFALLSTLDTILRLYMFIVFAAVIMSWLIQYNVVNRSNQFVYMLGNILYRMTEPLLGRIRRYLPDLGGLDLSPIILLLAIIFLRSWLSGYLFRLASPF